MEKKAGLGIVLVLGCVCLMSQTAWGSSYRGGESLKENFPIYGEIGSSPTIRSDETILLASSSSHGGGGKKEPANSLVFEWEPLLVNLADAGGKRYLKVTMKFELSDPKLHEEITERDYEMKDAMIMVLSSKEYDDISTAGGKAHLKQEILNRLNKIVKNGQVKEIYFTDFIVQ
jgi:flagellar basal body-associated protein FliL